MTHKIYCCIYFADDRRIKDDMSQCCSMIHQATQSGCHVTRLIEFPANILQLCVQFTTFSVLHSCWLLASRIRGDPGNYSFELFVLWVMTFKKKSMSMSNSLMILSNFLKFLRINQILQSYKSLWWFGTWQNEIWNFNQLKSNFITNWGQIWDLSFWKCGNL